MSANSGKTHHTPLLVRDRVTTCWCKNRTSAMVLSRRRWYKRTTGERIHARTLVLDRDLLYGIPISLQAGSQALSNPGPVRVQFCLKISALHSSVVAFPSCPATARMDRALNRHAIKRAPRGGRFEWHFPPHRLLWSVLHLHPPDSPCTVARC